MRKYLATCIAVFSALALMGAGCAHDEGGIDGNLSTQSSGQALVVSVSPPYVQGERAVAFEGILRDGTHDYQAIYSPIGDPSRCAGPWACPEGGSPYASGVITVQSRADQQNTGPTIESITYPHSCGEEWQCRYVERVFNDPPCVELFSRRNPQSENPFGMAKVTRIVSGYNTCRDPTSEQRGGDAAWHADWQGKTVVCPSFVMSDLTFGSCCDLVAGECQ
jgi:hypothetical protein